MEREEIIHIFTAITGTEPPASFGEPFRSAFTATYTNGSNEEIAAAAYICSMFLSSILEGFPTEKLHTFVNYIKENCYRFMFDCKMYDTILEKIDDDSLKRVIILDKRGKAITTECSREDIKEAFDFYTNR
ncbi:MAG: hypothetical protein IKY37_05170 [Bacteroidaceae bacterium]|nr:hypothetical protein [Bacteroidaceae bacterium]